MIIVKTSITLSVEVLKAIDQYIGEYKSRSAFLETAARKFIAQWNERKLNSVIWRSLIAMRIRSTLRQKMYSLIRFRCETKRVVQSQATFIA